MNLKLSHLTLMFSLIFVSCKSTLSDHVWLFEDHNIERVNGSVREIVTGDSIKDHTFSKTTFDRKGNINDRYDYLNSVYELNGKSSKYITIRFTKYKTVYDSHGNRSALICEVEGTDAYPDEKKPVEKWHYVNKYHLDSDGRPVSDFNENDTIGDYHSFKYNKQGEFITWTDVGNAHLASQIYRYQYDKDHKVIREKLFEDSTLIYDIKTTYYKFDTKGNWIIKAIKYTRDVSPKSESSNSTITRKITYY
jgi:hypothetical protein